jgi:DNA-binding NtrC family response regulator
VEVENLSQKASILVVDDDAGIRETLLRILEKEGYLVEPVENGQQAIEASKKWFFNVALIDIRLPDMEGTELLHRLKETEPKIVKIIITGYPSLKNAIEAVNKGADGYVLKPFEPGKLLMIIRKHLKKQRKSVKYSEEKVARYIESRAREIQLERRNKRVH